MMKLISSLLMLVILCVGLHSINGEKLKCRFEDHNYQLVGTVYSCMVNSLDNSFDNMTIDGYIGVHMASKNDKDVKAIFIEGAKTKYLPANLGSLFDLSAFLVHNSELVEINAENFLGMQNLELLGLWENKLTSVSSDTFPTLTKLKQIYLYSNQIKYIGSGVFDQLTNLERVYLQKNICVNKNYDGATAITQMKEDIKVNCDDPISTSTTTTTTTTTTQNPMEVELETLKNELAATTEELQKEKSENLKVKIERDAWIKEKEELMKERDDLKMELNNKTSEIIELNNNFQINCKQPIEALDVKLNGMFQQILNSSQENQMKCNEIIKLRAELVTAKEEHKKEQLEILKVNKERDALMKKKDALMIYHNALMKDKEQLKKELNEAKASCKINERSSV